MLLLALALSAATAGAPRAHPQAHAARTHSVRRARARHARIAAARVNILVPFCGQGGACSDPNARYRLPLRESDVVDFKTRAVEKGSAAPCGTTGSSICTSKGMTLVRAPLDGS